jgi:hypothetical protein
MSDKEKYDAIKAGVTDAWDHWLAQREVSLPQLIDEAVRDVVREYINRHGLPGRTEQEETG